MEEGTIAREVGTMHALVVYESMFGNTEKVAEAIGEGLSRHLSVDVVEVGHAPSAPAADVDLVVVGGPTHAFGLSRSSTREDAGRKAQRPVVSAGIGLREWLDELPEHAPGPAAAAFDTRVKKPFVPGSAAKAADRRLQRRGWPRAAHPESFIVQDTPGPLAPGELDRARAWGEDMARSLIGTKQARP